MSKIARRAKRAKKRRDSKLPREEQLYRPPAGSLPWLVMQAIQDRPGITEEALVALVQDTPSQLYQGRRDVSAVLECLAELRERGVLRTGEIPT